jgi:hypothetical protein
MGDIKNEIENKAEEAKSNDEQHLGDAMDNENFHADGAGRKSDPEKAEAVKKRRLA